MLRYRTIFYSFSGALVLASIVALVWFGMPLGPEFRGGSLLEADFGSEPMTVETLRRGLADFGFSDITIQALAGNAFVLRMGAIDEPTHSRLADALGRIQSLFTQRRFTTIGPALGRELFTRMLWGVAFAFLGIFVYVAAAFRRSGFRRAASGAPSASLYGLIGVGTLVHDVFITAGAMTLFASFRGLEFGAPFIAALLTVGGYSINDTIIIFDRIREELRSGAQSDIGGVIGRAVKVSVRRSVFTSLTTLLALVAIFLFGGAELAVFSLTLIVGIVIGTYSSLCIASPLLYDLIPRPRH